MWSVCQVGIAYYELFIVQAHYIAGWERCSECEPTPLVLHRSGTQHHLIGMPVVWKVNTKSWATHEPNDAVNFLRLQSVGDRWITQISKMSVFLTLKFYCIFCNFCVSNTLFQIIFTTLRPAITLTTKKCAFLYKYLMNAHSAVLKCLILTGLLVVWKIRRLNIVL
jgi:hypothetical protein